MYTFTEKSLNLLAFTIAVSCLMDELFSSESNLRDTEIGK